MISLTSPLRIDDLKRLRAGDMVSLSGSLYTARDAAHQKMIEAMDTGEELPFNVEGSIIYYTGPTPAKPGMTIGSAGPTTSGRMDNLTIPLLEMGLMGTIGKGTRSPEVIESMKKNQAVYFLAIGGAGALISHSIKKSELVAYPELGSEAVRKLLVEDLFLIVCLDLYGNYLYKNIK